MMTVTQLGVFTSLHLFKTEQQINFGVVLYVTTFRFHIQLYCSSLVLGADAMKQAVLVETTDKTRSRALFYCCFEKLANHSLM